MKKALIVLLSLMFIVPLIAGCGDQKAEPKKDKKIVIRFSSNATESAFKTQPMGLGIMKFIDEVQKRSNGRVEVKLYKGGQLAKSAEEVIGGMQNGVFEMANWATGNFGEYSKAYLPLDLPYLFTTDAGYYKFIDGPIGQKMDEQVLKDTGIRMLGYLDLGFRHITNSKRPITSPDDMVGLKIRTMTDPHQMAAMKALGAAPTPMAYAEIFTALQQKVIDAQENPIVNIYIARFYEVQKYMSLTSHGYGFTGIVISDKFFKSLPPDIQKIISESAELAEKYSREVKDKVEAEQLQAMSKHMEITKLTPEQLKAFQAKAQVTWPDIKKDIGAEYYDQVMNEVAKIEKETAKK